MPDAISAAVATGPAGDFIYTAGPENVLNAAEVAERLGLSPATVYRMAEDGRLPSFKYGPGKSAVRFRPSEIEQWLDDKRRGPRPSQSPLRVL